MSALKRLGIEPEISPANQEISVEQEQTAKCFGFKWCKRETYESEKMKAKSKKWLLERYCSGDPDKLIQWLSGGRKIILDAGCGSGYSSILLFGDHLNNHDYLGTDISNSVDIAKIRFAENGYTGDFLQVNLMELPMPADSIDIIFSEGVLHHTDSVEASINFLTTKLKQGGRFMFYVYARKAPLREYTDDHIRHYLKTLDDEAAWEALKPLTKLGIALGELNTEIQVEEDIPYLGIKSGKFDLQRLFYWNICKLFYDPELSLDELNHINFDWFRPLNCHRHTAGEVVQFCSEAGLKIEHLDEQMSGITIVGRKA